MGDVAPTTRYGATLTLIGGLLLLIFGNPALPEGMLFIPYMTYMNLATPVGQLSVVCGISILIFDYLMFRGRKWSGMVIAILAGLSIVVGLDRYYVGSIMAFIGGLVGYFGR
ncbi:MAG: hypothetical protein WED04_08465 [Promethearchaeati archaeon SRVP18_Atabeyarchaeia-1]